MESKKGLGAHGGDLARRGRLKVICRWYFALNKVWRDLWAWPNFTVDSVSSGYLEVDEKSSYNAVDRKGKNHSLNQKPILTKCYD